MISRANQPDTKTDAEISACLQATPPKSFIMKSGAGSGKTTSLIKALKVVIEFHGDNLSLRRQKVACITYTEIAASEILADIGNHPLVHVSTIHSFMWSLIRAFQKDIRYWVSNRIGEKLQELQDASAAFGPRVKQVTREKTRRDIARYEKQAAQIGQVNSFKYGTGSNYPAGTLGHDDIIKMVPQLLLERALLRTILAQQFPFLFVDESQDTFESVVQALKAVDGQPDTNFCLGFFGDPMQRIYMTGVGDIEPEDGWQSITKTENFRCPKAVLAVANSIRRPIGDVVQDRGRIMAHDGCVESVQGSANLFILPADGHRDEILQNVRAWVATHNSDQAWLSDEIGENIKILVIVHRMAAKRLGFADLYSALNDKAPDSFKTGFLDATAWPLRPFISFILPLADAMRNSCEFEVMNILRAHSPLISRDYLVGINVEERLAQLKSLTLRIGQLMGNGSTATNADLLKFLHDTQLFLLDPRILAYLELGDSVLAPQALEEGDDEDADEISKEVAAMEAFLACPATQLWGYRKYINEESPFSTQQGIKGAEFERVLVVLDDDEGTHVQFSYDKYLGIKPLSARDEENMRAGKDTTVERTRRLFYVCCTRALQDLAVVLFTSNIELAKQQVLSLEIFPSDSIRTLKDLNAS